MRVFTVSDMSDSSNYNRRPQGLLKTWTKTVLHLVKAIMQGHINKEITLVAFTRGI